MGTFLIDHPNREIPPLKEMLSGSNSTVDHFFDFQDLYFGSFKDECDILGRIKKDQEFILTPSFNVKRTPVIALRSKLSRVPLIVYHSEQFFQDYLDDEKLNLKFMDSYIKDVHAHFVWGDYFKGRLIDAGIPEEKIFVVGNIKTIFAKNKNTNQEETEFDYLFLSNFVLADYDDDRLESFRAEFSLPDDYAPVSYVASCRKGMFSFILRVAQEFPNKKILVRRHPGEDLSPYEKLSEEHNVFLSSDGPIVDDIRASGLILSQDSTSIFECEAFGRPFMSVAFGKPDERYRAEPKNVFELMNVDLAFSILKSEIIGPVDKPFGLPKETMNFYVRQYVDYSNFLEALEKVQRMNHSYSYGFSFLKNLSLVTAKYLVWKLTFSSYLKVLFRPVKRRLLLGQERWMQQDHYFDKSKV